MHSLKDKTPRREGFTLIELLTVIAIIGILAAIIIPTVGRVRATAKAGSCASQLRQISMALVLYQQENKGVLPAGSVGSPSIIWQKALKPYLPLKGQSDTSATHPIFTCPSAEYNGYTTDQLAHTYAGTGASGGALDGPVATARLEHPRGLAYSQGVLYVQEVLRMRMIR